MLPIGFNSGHPMYKINEVLNNPGLSLRDIKRRVLEADRLKIIEKSENHPSLTYVLP